MKEYGRVTDKVLKWMRLLASAGYSNPIAENRRLVISHIAGFPEKTFLPIIIEAVFDPDKTVRRKAIEALSEYPSAGIIKVLDMIEQGTVKLREDYKKPGIEFGYEFDYDEIFMAPGVYTDTDPEAAKKIKNLLKDKIRKGEKNLSEETLKLLEKNLEDLREKHK